MWRDAYNLDQQDIRHDAIDDAPLFVEPGSAEKFEGLKQRGKSRLHDASNPSLALESRFEVHTQLAYLRKLRILCR